MRFVAVTSCPTGIAHSQMAAESLRNAAEKLGHEITVEIQGAMGTEGELTAGEIENADAVIIATDTAVSRERFEEKPLVKGTVKEGVSDAERLMEDAVERVAGTGTEPVRSDVASDDRVDSEPSTVGEKDRPERVGGDPSKGLFARLKRFFG